MVEPCGADFGDGVGIKGLGQVDAFDTRATGLAAGGDYEIHGAMLRRLTNAVNPARQAAPKYRRADGQAERSNPQFSGAPCFGS